MTRAELVDRIAVEARLTKEDAARTLDAMIKAITVTLRKGEKVMLVDFGTFYVARRKARMSRDLNNAGDIFIPSRKVPRFTSGLMF